MTEQKIREMAEEMLQDDTHFVVDVRISSGRTSRKVVVYVDGDEGISIDECAALSRSLGAKLEEDEAFPEAYTLEVSTPGLDHPLEGLRRYRKNIGRDLKVSLTEGKDVKGKLVDASEERIVLEKKVGKGKKATVETVKIPLDKISKSIVQISFK